MTRALDGLLVLDLGQIYNGPYCGMLLAHLGAEVIKVESPAGDPTRWRAAGEESYPFLMLNGNKHGLRLNLKDEAGRALFLRLAERADVVVENFGPGVIERLGLGHAALSEVNPRIILASGKGFGNDGPYRDYPAMDITIQAMTGVMEINGFPDSPPVKAGIAPADFAGGTHLLAAILAALYQRERTGQGQHVEVSMQDALLPTLTSNLGGYYSSGGTLPERTGNRHGGLSVCPYNVYPTADGWVSVLCVTDRHWERFCAVMDRPDLWERTELRTTVGRSAHMDEVDGIVGEWTARLPKAEAFRLLREAGIPAAPLLRLAEVAHDPHIRHRGMLRDVEHPTMGTVTTFGTPLRMSRSEPVASTAAPLHGQHSRDVLRRHLDLTDAELDRLAADQVI
ncbi:MAG TPA: CoA transferase [Streptosporangiaceae bacterium]|jgi:formyl-CoA transferase